MFVVLLRNHIQYFHLQAAHTLFVSLFRSKENVMHISNEYQTINEKIDHVCMVDM